MFFPTFNGVKPTFFGVKPAVLNKDNQSVTESLSIFIVSSLLHAVLVHVKMAALVWSNVTETANASVQKGTPEHTVKTVRNTTKTFHLHSYFQCTS